MAKYAVTGVVVLLICAAATTLVEATQATLQWTGTIAPGAVVHVSATTAATAGPPWNLDTNGWAGQYQFTVTATDCENLVPTGLLKSYCMDLADEPAGSQVYDLVALTSAPLPTTYTQGAPMTATQAENLRKLWSRHSGDVGTNNSKAASFNLAVWEIIYEHTGVLNVLNNGSFQSSSTTEANQANTWLADLGSWQVGEFMPDLRALVNVNHQDMLHVIPTGGSTYVPEPVTMLGMFLGLGSVGAYIRRRRMA